jgi:hypothetical protein
VVSSLAQLRLPLALYGSLTNRYHFGCFHLNSEELQRREACSVPREAKARCITVTKYHFSLFGFPVNISNVEMLKAFNPLKTEFLLNVL